MQDNALLLCNTTQVLGGCLAQFEEKQPARLTTAMAAEEGDWECPLWCVTSSSRGFSPYECGYSSRDAVTRVRRRDSVHAILSAFSPFAFLLGLLGQGDWQP